jgi:CubicO group peptidase (beta-lactamase class C family)
VIFLRSLQQKNRTEGPASATFIETDQSSTSATLGDGGVYSNLADLAKWDDALAHHTLLSAEEMKPARTPFTRPGEGSGAGRLPKWSGDSGDSDPQAGKPVAYGFGWFLDAYVDAAGKSHQRMWHYGDTIGFKSAIMRFTGNATGAGAKGDRLAGLTIIILTNRTDIDPAKLAEQVAAAY